MAKHRIGDVGPATVNNPAMVAGFERSQQAAGYWAKINAKPTTQAA